MKTAMKKTYKAPELKAINIASAGVLLEGSPVPTGEITEYYDPTGDEDYDLLTIFDKDKEGWQKGIPD